MHPHLVVKKKGKFAPFFFRKITVTNFFISIFSISFFSKSERNDCHLFYYQKKEFESHRDIPQNNLTFYLDYQMTEPQKHDELGLLHPKIVNLLYKFHLGR